MLETAKVAKITGLPASTLRYYEEKGLIKSVGRKGLSRLFEPDIIEQLEFIALARIARFSLKDIAAMFSRNGAYHVDRQLLKEKAKTLDDEIKRLTAVRDGLLHVSDCMASSHSECPRFQKLLRVAAKKQSRDKHIRNKV
ncbi:helix-turn-helix domain-containing protein [Hirschia litorea]|uniref:Helix-turn-helix domain-containing protein n=1 Tax=Hirschia litorea TaxID=1199156 RepID=A0ABW2IQ52_9PROT